MKKPSIMLMVLVLILFVSSTNASADYWAKGVSELSGWFDAEKDSINTEDDDLCWAASASSILAWSGWNAGFTAKAGDGLEDAIFDWLEAEDPIDEGGWQHWAWNFWFTGTGTSGHYAGSAHTGFYTVAQYNDALDLSWDDDANALQTASNWLQNDYGVGLAIKGTGFYHAITLWGVDTDDSGNYLGVWITDSDDDKYGSDPRPNTLDYYTVFLDSGSWWLNIYGTTARITEMDALKMASVPEPSTMLLLGIGILALGSVRRRVKQI